MNFCICECCNVDLFVIWKDDAERIEYSLRQISTMIQEGYTRFERLCPNCQSFQSFRVGNAQPKEGNQMAEATGNPELSGITPETPAPTFQQPESLLNPETLAAVLSMATETVQAIADIPAQLEFIAMVNLSQKFIYPMEGGKVAFNEEGFRKVWNVLNQINSEQKGA